ncbi:hypothetical protein Q7C36_000084 [Tachysurus vachellii]|uniref:Uncharacterized protein n=1 Tax=Tachysurus vachellii TaxID=175792 RepID=A0AA88P156_TACVA|nr:hypothetical protein Q7C36_000084 [Tachysurus vachellii]
MRKFSHPRSEFDLTGSAVSVQIGVVCLIKSYAESSLLTPVCLLAAFSRRLKTPHRLKRLQPQNHRV